MTEGVVREGFLLEEMLGLRQASPAQRGDPEVGTGESGGQWSGAVTASGRGGIGEGTDGRSLECLAEGP
jgi:hypothetical protein